MERRKIYETSHGINSRSKRIDATAADILLPHSVPERIRFSLGVNPKICTDPSKAPEYSVYLYGPSGRGKTFTAAALMLHSIKETRKRYQCKLHAWINIPEFILDLRSTYYQSNNNDQNNIIKKLSLVDWICLDDLAAEKTTDWTAQVLYVIINNRYNSRKTTVITSNLSIDKLAEKMGDDRLSSRIAGMCKQIEVSGRDRRADGKNK